MPYKGYTEIGGGNSVNGIVLALVGVLLLALGIWGGGLLL
jgi:hypothetical protein